MDRSPQVSKLALLGTGLYALAWVALCIAQPVDWQLHFDQPYLAIRLGEPWSMPATYTGLVSNLRLGPSLP